MRFRPVLALLLLVASSLFATSAGASELIDEHGQAIPLAEADTILKATGLDALIDRSDYVVHARVGRRTAQWVNKNIESTYAISVQSTLKGSGPAEFELTVLGGDAPDGAPIGQYVRGAARLSPGEEVILFLRTDTEERLLKANARRMSAGMRPILVDPRSKLATSFAVTGGQKGKFNVVTLSDGSKFVTRLRPMPHMMSDPVSEAMTERLRVRLEGTKEERAALAREEWEEALDTWEAAYGVRPILPAEDLETPQLDPTHAPPMAPRRFATGPLTEAPARVGNPAGLPAEGYRPSIVTDPDAPEFRRASPRATLDALPYNASTMRRPMALGTFEALVGYRAGRAATVAAGPEVSTEEAR